MDGTDEEPDKHSPILFAVFLVLGFCIFAVPNYMGAARNLYEVGLTVLLVLLLLAVRKTRRLARFTSIVSSFVIAGVAYSSTYLVAHP